MAATLGVQKLLANVPHTVECAYYTTLDAGATITHSHLGPAGVEPDKVEYMVVERPATRDAVTMAWDESANDTTNDTIALQFDTTPGGDLTDAQVKVLITWLSAATGGIS